MGAPLLGTSGLRKKTVVFKEPHYLQNWVQSLFTTLGDVVGQTMVLGGDGRYWSRDAIRIIARVAAANGVSKLLVGQNGIFCTPAVSAIIRARGILGGIILTASHNPGGPDNDFGIKYNISSGGPAPDSMTSGIFEATKVLKEYLYAVSPVGSAYAGTPAAVEGSPDVSADPFSSVDIGSLGETVFTETESGRTFAVEVVDSAEEYVALLTSMFDFDKLKSLFSRPDFSFIFDGMSGVTGPYARRIFVELLGGSASNLMRCEPLEDFGGGHPDPNLTYAADLVSACDPSKSPCAPVMGAASDGDGDRNMILGRGFFVTPSDSLAVIAAKGPVAIPWFGRGLKGVARSMPTAGAVDRVAARLGIEMHETPTGWKYFGNLMDAGRTQICGEESFGTGSDHVREKDGIFAVLCWLSIIAYESEGRENVVSIEEIVTNHWKEYGRNFFSRYDYEEVSADDANAMMAHLAKVQDEMNTKRVNEGGMPLDDEFDVLVTTADDFSYKDPVDGSLATGQGLRFVFEDGSRVIFRLSGTGSAGATIRLYVEKYEPDPAAQSIDAQAALRPFIDVALKVSRLTEFTGRREPSVIT